jgi:hypothetical protein
VPAANNYIRCPLFRKWISRGSKDEFLAHGTITVLHSFALMPFGETISPSVANAVSFSNLLDYPAGVRRL